MATDNLLALDKQTFYVNVERKLENGNGYFQPQERSMEDDSFPYFFLLWLEHGMSFRVRAEHGTGYVWYTVRLRKMAGRLKPVWYAEARIAGKLHQKYVGQSSDISLPKLEQLATHFAAFKGDN